MGITIWLLPSQDHRKALTTLVNVGRNHAASKSPSSFPKIIPHITLAALPSAPLVPLSRVLSALKTPFQVSLASLDVGSVYFRSVYLTVQSSPHLVHLHGTIHQRLAINPKTPAFPHISLAYIDDEDIEERARYAEMLLTQGFVQSDREGGGVLIKDENTHQLIESIDITEAWLVKCDGPVETWEVLEKVVLVA